MGIKASSNIIEFPKNSLSTSSSSSASFIHTSTLNIEVEHLETFTLVWLDTQIDEDEQNSSLKKRLRQYVTYLVTFDDLKSCEQWLKNRPNDDKILLLVPGELGKKIVPNIHQLTSIIGIYVFCWRPEIHTVWTSNYSKVRGVISKAETLVQQISKDADYFENIENSKGIKVFENDHQTSIPNPENSSFIWFPLCLETLISSSYFPSSASPSELIQILRRYASNDQEGLNLIKEFEQKYDKQKAIAWLTNNTSLGRFTNKALREQDISMLFYLRFFLIDISNQLINHQLQSAHVYRKQIMSPTLIDNIRANINNYLMFNQFLYTSTEPSEFSSIDLKDDRDQIVLIDIRADNRDGTVPFVCLQKISNTINNQNGSDVLFMCGSIFKILSLTKNQNSYLRLELLLAGNKDFKILNNKKQKLRRNKDLTMIIDLLDHSKQLDKANIYSQHLLRELPSDHFLIPQIEKSINSKVQPVSLRSAQFIVIDLSTRLNPLASAMLNALCSLTNDSILICDKISDINFDALINKTIFIFASSQIISSITKNLKPLTQIFILEEDKNKDDQPRHFTDSEDLIFQLADELYRYYKWESDEDLRSGDNSTTNEKKELANQIHKELKKVQRRFSDDDDDDKLKSCITTLVWLTTMCNSDNSITKIRNLIENNVTSFSIFYDAEECYDYICTTEYSHFVFLIIDDDYQDVSGFQKLDNIKNIYRYVQSWATKETINMQTITDIKFDMNLYSHLNKRILILYQMEGTSLALPLSNLDLMTFIQPFDDISRCRDYITINDRKTFTLFAYSENIRTWLSNNNHIPNNVDSIIIFCPYDSEVRHWERWTRRYTQKIKGVIRHDALERELLMFGIKYIEDVSLHFQNNEGILELLKEDRRKMCLALTNYFKKEIERLNEFIRSDVTETP